MRRTPRTDYQLAPNVVAQVPWLRRRLLAWFKKNGRVFPWREPGQTPYQVLVAEILLQRTPARAVARVYIGFLERYSCWEALDHATMQELQEYFRPLGLWRLKAKILKDLAGLIVEKGGEVPRSRAELEQFDGVGQYTASAVLNVVHGQPEPLLDANMSRVLERFFGPRIRADIRDDPYLHHLSRLVVAGKNSLRINWAVLDLSALVCKPRGPLHDQCVLRDKCRYYADEREEGGADGKPNHPGQGAGTDQPA